MLNKEAIKQTTWNLKPLFSGDNDKAMEKKRSEWLAKSNEFIKKWKDRDDYLKYPAILKQALDEYNQWENDYGTSPDEAYYFWLRQRQDETDPKIKARFNKIEELSIKLANDIQFFPIRIARIPEKEQKKFLEYPELKQYKHYLYESFINARYLLSEPEEKIMNLKAKASQSMWIDMVNEFLVKEEAVVIDEDCKKRKKSFSELYNLILSRKKKTRDSAASVFNDILAKHTDSAEAELNAILYDKKVNDELRGFTRPDQARHIADEIETEIVDLLVETVSSRFDISRRYYKLKAKLLGVKKLKYHERNVPYGKIDKKYSYPDSVKLVNEVFEKLGPKFSAIFNSFVGDGHIDVFPRKGKASGAFCVCMLKTQPTYILLNHSNNLREVLTLAHESGHGIHNELIREKQPAIYFGVSTATAEVSSTFMEDFVLQRLLKDADDELKLTLMVQKMDDLISTIIRQVACYKFEQELHSEFRKKSHLTKEDISKIFIKNMEDYMGPYVEQTGMADKFWVYWSHIRRFFYVYSYASGLLISKSLQHSVRENPANISKVKEFMSAGVSDTPKNIFLKAGIDISKKEFWNAGLDEIEELLNETEKLAKKLGKI